MISKELLNHLYTLRRALHQDPELSGNEHRTSKQICSFLERYKPDKIIKNLGGTGLGIMIDSGKPGPTVAFRAELDALPIQENTGLPYQSKNKNIAHLCGHDGHMSIITGLGVLFAQKKPCRGKLVLIYQPSEETGQGALKIIQDPQYECLSPDYVFALHNIPKQEKHTVILKEGVFTSASKGMVIKLYGITSHAAEPEKGKSPAMAMAGLFQMLDELPRVQKAYHATVKATIVHALLGEIAFGTSPGYAEVRATLRAFSNEDLETLSAKTEAGISKICSNFGLAYEISYTEEFPATVNDRNMVQMLKKSAESLGLKTYCPPEPMSWSEDFAHFANRHAAVYFGLGAGRNIADLHQAHYDFPDEIIGTGINLLYNTANAIFANA